MARPYQTNLTAGEISRQASARFDRDFYGAGAAAIENMFVMIEGGATRAPGGLHVGGAKDDDAYTRMIRFVKSDEGVVMIEAGADYLRFWDAFTHQRLEDPNGPIEIAGFDAATLPKLYWFQSADVMYFTSKNGDMQPKALVRFADDDWQLSDYDIREGPFLPPNLDARVMKANNSVGSVTVDLADGFTPKHVGARFRLFTAYQGVPFQQWESEEEGLKALDQRVYQGRVYAVVGSGTASNSPPVHEEQTVSDGGGNISWTYLHDLAGVVRITNVQGVGQAQAVVESRLPDNPIETTRWAEGYFSDARGWPFVGGIFQERQIFAGGPLYPDTLWLSRVNGYNEAYADFKQSAGGGEVNDDHAVVRTLADGEVKRISWVIAGKQVVLGHAGGIVAVGGPSLNEPITPAGASAALEDPPPGTYFKARAVRAGDSIVYASTSGRKVIALNPIDFSYQTLTARARNKGARRFIEFAYAGEIDYRIYALREDGRVFACAFDREQGVVAWSTLFPAGHLNGDGARLDSIAVAADETGRDRLWYVVARTINGVTRRTIEVLEIDYDAEERLPDEAVFADAAIRFDNWNADEAKTVRVVHAQGQSSAKRGQVVTLHAVGHSFDASWAGREIRLRRRHAPEREGDVVGEVAAQVLAPQSAVAQARLLTDVAEGLHDVALYQFAMAETSISGLDHLEGETVGVWGDGADMGDFDVAGGAIELDESVARASVGLRKKFRLKSLPIVGMRRDGVTKGKTTRASRVYADLLDCAVEGADVRLVTDNEKQNSEKMVPRNSDDLVTLAAGLRSGQIAQPLAGGKAKTIELEIEGDGLGPFTILAMGVEYET